MATLERKVVVVVVVVESVASIIRSRAIGVPMKWAEDMVDFVIIDLADVERERKGAIVAGAVKRLDTGASGARAVDVVVAPEFVVVAAEFVVVLAVVAAGRRPTAGIVRKCL